MMATRINSHLALGAATIQEFRSSLRGELILPGDPPYEQVRKVWNGMIDKRPALIARCAGAADVVACIQFVRSYDLPLAVRGGGHSIAGFSSCDGGLVIDLSLMKGIAVEPIRRTARAQPGLTWGEFDRETQAFGLATTGGLISTTGIAGFTLGGGIGWLMRQYGLACDNLLSARMVTADGRLLNASEQENAELYWGVRGGGGNFGVVTSFEYQLYPVNHVIGGMVLHPASRAREVLQFYRDYVATIPDELALMFAFLTAPPAPFVPESLQGQPAVGIVACYCGSPKTGHEIVRPLKEFGPPVVDVIGPMPYTALQTMLDAAAPPGLLNYWKSGYLQELSRDAIETLVIQAAKMASPLSTIHIQQLGGGVSRVPADATAYAYRDAPFVVNIISTWTAPSESEQHVSWTRETWNALQPCWTRGAYVNFMGDESAEQVKQAYGINYARLVALKNQYDPTNLFRLNHNITPSIE